MVSQNRRRLRRSCFSSLETLERRNLLSSIPINVAQPDGNAALVSTLNSHTRVIDSTGGYFISTERAPGASGSKSAPTLQGDFNGNGVTDLLSTESDQKWWLYLNDGTQLYQLDVGAGLPNAEVIGTGDFDQDGSDDILSLTDTGDLWVSKFAAGTFEHTKWGEFAHPVGWSQLFVGDFNGDQLPDVLGGEVGGHWWLASNVGDGSFNNYRWGRYQDFGWQDVVHGDFTGDQIADVMTLAPDNTWWIWEGTESGFTSSRYFGHWKMRDHWHNIRVGDFNGDAISDVVGRSEDGTLWVGQSVNGTLTSWRWATGWIDSADWSQITILDINGDGRDDQIGRAQDHTWWYAESQGTSFLNHFWNDGGEADFVLQNFRLQDGIDLIDSFPDGGEDTRTDEVFVQQSVDPSVQVGPIRQPNIHTSRNLTYFRSLAEPPAEDLVVSVAPPVAENEEVTESDSSSLIATNLVAKIVDGRLVLSGPGTELLGMDVTSKGGYLKLETVDIPERGIVPLADPFEPSTGVILANQPGWITIGTLQVPAVITQDTKTSILYSGPLEDAIDDLTVNIGLVEDGPPQIVQVFVGQD